MALALRNSVSATKMMLRCFKGKLLSSASRKNSTPIPLERDYHRRMSRDTCKIAKKRRVSSVIPLKCFHSHAKAEIDVQSLFAGNLSIAEQMPRPCRSKKTISLQYIRHYVDKCCPSPCPCPCPGNCLPPPSHCPPKCIQYMTGYFYYPYGWWYCGPYHQATCAPGGPVCPGKPCKPCCPPCPPCCVVPGSEGMSTTAAATAAAAVPEVNVKAEAFKKAEDCFTTKNSPLINTETASGKDKPDPKDKSGISKFFAFKGTPSSRGTIPLSHQKKISSSPPIDKKYFSTDTDVPKTRECAGRAMKDYFGTGRKSFSCKLDGSTRIMKERENFEVLFGNKRPPVEGVKPF